MLMRPVLFFDRLPGRRGLIGREIHANFDVGAGTAQSEQSVSINRRVKLWPRPHTHS